VGTPGKPLVVWDGDCAFCRAWVERWRSITGDRVEYAPDQEVATRFPEIPPEQFKRAVHLIEPDGRVAQGAEAVFRALAYAPRHGAWLALYESVGPFRWVSEAVYRWIAGHRNLLYRLTRVIWGEHVVPPGERLTTWIFVRLLGVIFGVAFVSAWVQINGLVGDRGILPARALLQLAHDQLGPSRYWLFPTLCWLGAGDGALQALCALGVALSALVALGIAPLLALFGCWALYLSLNVVGQDFLWYQWDSLLLEAGSLALLLCPWRWISRPAGPLPSRAGLWLERWLLFRLMFSSAVVKLTSGDQNWRNLTALQYHYQSQCLPTWVAWYAHHLPAAFHRLSAIGMFTIEGAMPFLVFAPRRIRFFGAGAIAFLQILILLTGNYGFFNWIVLALCVLSLDDAVWPAWLRGPSVRSDAAVPRGAWPTWIVRPAAVALVLLSLVPLLSAFRRPISSLGPIAYVYGLVSPLRSINPYGLFAVMTTRRMEIVVEGSEDGVSWLPYEFKYKPGDLARRPPFVAPHQPRLDWQMWFAALSDYRREPWFLYFCQRLLEGSRPVLALLQTNPFPRAPPRFIRASFYEYRFSDPTTRRRSHAWWTRSYVGLYCPILTLEDGKLQAVLPD
jgi:predicted DCC family thiol-disulfide oxidoreductase YuxK